MNKQILSPFDCDLCAMVEDLTGNPVEVNPQRDYFVLSWEQCECDRTTADGKKATAIQQAVNGRLGTRAIAWEYKDGRQSVTVDYDPTEYPEEIRTRLTAPDFTAGQRYCRTLLEVDAIQVRRDNVESLIKFTGGGTMTTPRTPDGRAVYSFPDGNGIFIDAPETWYIVREPNGRLTARPEREFNREFEPKGIRTVGNYDGKTARPSGSEIMETFNRLFGTDIDSRNRKLSEEYDEYMEAGKTPYELLQSAYDKVIGRQTDPMYKRTHPHEKADRPGCGNCSHFTNEDVNGYGYCEAFKSEQRCGKFACQEYKPKN